MSKAARYQGIGAALSTFGHGMLQQQAESARERRERRLMELREQYRIEADERAMDRQAQDQQFRIDEANRADAIAFGRRQQERTEDREREAPMEQARLGLLEAQTQETQARAERGRVGDDPARWREMSLHENRLIEQGMDPEQAYEEAKRMVYPQRPDWDQQQMTRERVNLVRSIRASLEDEFDRDRIFERYNIPEGTPSDEAVRIIFEAEWPAIEASVFGGQSTGHMGPTNNPGPTENPEPGLLEQGNRVSGAKGAGAMAREFGGDALSMGGDVLRAGVTPPWMQSSPIRQGIESAVDDFRSGWREQGGEVAPESLPDGLIRDVAADLSSEGEPFVREQLRMAGVPPGQIDQIIEIAKASRQ